MADNMKEMTKTGGGSAYLVEDDSFGFPQKQICGLSNRFESDALDEDVDPFGRGITNRRIS